MNANARGIPQRTLRQLLSATSFALLCSCGGGGGGGSDTTPAQTPPVAQVPTPSAVQQKTLVWSDEFEADGLPDSIKWDYDTDRNRLGWYNNELQYYARSRMDNSKVQGGKLLISAIRERFTAPADYGQQNFTSARMVTRGKFSFTYGSVEVRAKMPCSLGTWPAIWMLGSGGRWPEDGEIDLLEQKGFSQGDKQQVLGTIHTRAYNYFNGSLGVGQGSSRIVADACNAFHVYQLTWTPDVVRLGVDGVDYFEYANPKLNDYDRWPFDRPQYLILNLAVGGDLGGPVPSNFTRDQMEVDYVRVYQLK